MTLNKPMHNIYPWQQTQWSHIDSLITQSRLPHALMLSGSKDLGKRAFAMALAARLFCNSSASQACGNCQGCHLMQSESHPDFHLVEPLEKAKNIKIDQVRALVTALAHTSQQGGPQVVVLCPAEDMNVAAANALLKTLEEPQGQVFFLLVTHQPSSVPATIRSRCQSIAFPIPDITTSITWLATQNISQTLQPQMLLKLAANIPLTALTFTEEEHLQMHQKVLACFLDMRLSNVSPSQAASALSDVVVENMFNTLWSALMDMIRLQTNCLEGSVANVEYLEKLRQVSQQIQWQTLFGFLDELMTFKRKINSKIALNQQLLLEGLFIKWRALGR